MCRQVAARAHPDLLVLQRDTEDGKTRRGIPVDDARGLPEFFAKSPASAPYRVAIIDAADDLNANAANAVLKTLEEPPSRGVLLLVSHTPGGLLATIRSRCRRLRFALPPPETAVAWVADKARVGPDDAERLVAMAHGGPGLAWRLSFAGALDIDAQARALLASLSHPDERVAASLADSFRGPMGGDKFQLFFNRLSDIIHERSAVDARMGQGTRLDRWAEAWEYLVELPRAVEAVNLDRADAFMTALGRLRAIA